VIELTQDLIASRRRLSAVSRWIFIELFRQLVSSKQWQWLRLLRLVRLGAIR